MTQMRQKDQPTNNNPNTEILPTSNKYSRDGAIFRWLYLRWVQILEFADLLGTDGRPSGTKMMSFSISSTVLFTAIHKTFTTSEVKIWTWEMFWVLFLCCAVMFGRWGFDRFIMVMKEKQTMQ